MVDLSTIKKENFDPHVNTIFTFKTENNLAVDFELIETSSLHSSNIESFKLLFKGPVDTIYPQKIYHFEHTALGEIELFIVPIKKDDVGIYYETIFSRLKK